jgi:alpha-N-acetylglucosaminidase
MLLAMVANTMAADDVEQARALARRLSPALAGKVEFRQIAAANGKDVFTLGSEGGKVIIGGNNAGSMAVGLNRYLNRYCMTTVSWYADVPVQLPRVLPDVPATERVTARVSQRFFLNYCTWGYTMPFWQWHDWERFIDWMALNGVNLPLAITGQEAVWYNVWTSLGLSDKQVRAYFTGPAYLPWHRMANIDGWCGPLPKEWLDGQTVLQQHIVERERALGMRPVLPAFAGHVPGALRELFPNADIQALGSWAGFDDQYRTCFLNSEDPLYSRIQRMFLEEQTRLFGTDHIYGIDPFNEVDPPSFEPEYLNKVSQHIYESLTAVDPDAEWLQMAWFLYYQRKDYTPERTRALLTGVPQGKMTMLDYYCE